MKIPAAEFKAKCLKLTTKGYATIAAPRMSQLLTRHPRSLVSLGILTAEVIPKSSRARPPTLSRP